MKAESFKLLADLGYLYDGRTIYSFHIEDYLPINCSGKMDLKTILTRIIEFERQTNFRAGMDATTKNIEEIEQHADAGPKPATQSIKLSKN